MATANPFDEVKDTEELPIEARPYACTVVNLLPREILEEKPHLLPGAFLIPAAEWGDIAVLHVEEALHYVPNPLIDDGKPGSSIKQVTSPKELARSICEDYNCAHVATGDGSGPSLFWVEGRLSASEVKRYYGKQIHANRLRVIQWFRNLCAMADADWQKNRNMLAVSDLQRMAAKTLGVKKEWVEFVSEESVPCKFCTVSVPPTAIICPNCKQILNQAAYKTLGGA